MIDRYRQTDIRSWTYELELMLWVVDYQELLEPQYSEVIRRLMGVFEWNFPST